MSKQIYNISKYNASGNDFIIFHDFIKKDRATLAKQLCNRHSGIGADGLVVCLPDETYDFKWQFYNCNGSIAKMCGNASRATAHYALKHGLAKEQMTFLTLAGPIKATVKDNIVQSELTPPIKKKRDIIEFGYNWSLIEVGVPHLVTFDASMEIFDLQMAQSLREKYDCNINIAKIYKNHIQVRTYERGVEAETLSCGTGIASCYYEALQQKMINCRQIKAISTKKEKLTLGFNGTNITLKGEVTNTFNTTWTL